MQMNSKRGESNRRRGALKHTGDVVDGKGLLRKASWFLQTRRLSKASQNRTRENIDAESAAVSTPPIFHNKRQQRREVPPSLSVPARRYTEARCPRLVSCLADISFRLFLKLGHPRLSSDKPPFIVSSTLSNLSRPILSSAFCEEKVSASESPSPAHSL